MKTLFARENEVEKKWHLVDADGMVVGRLASQIASILRGKNKPIFTPHADTGDFVVIINAERVRLTGNKLENKVYYRHSGYPGGIKKRVAKDLMKDAPEEIIMSAVRGMLPKNRLGRQQIKKLKVYRGAEHPHSAQKPEALDITRQQGA
jgi:large subunit ribosomal protein L13